MKKLIPLLLILALLCAGCTGHTAPVGSTVAATTAPLAQFAEALCQGTDITVSLIVSEPVSCLHDYTLTVEQMRIVQSADCVLLSGVGLEDFMADALSSAKQAVDCSQGISLRSLEGEDDPHIWLSPENAKQMAQNAADGLISLYPQWEETINKNLTALEGRFAELQDYGDSALEGLSCRELITFHDGFGYFAEAFSLDILASMEEESGSEASASALREICTLVEEHSLPAVFTEENGSDAAAGIVSRETGCKVFSLTTALGDSDYFTAMTGNIDTVKEALS